MDMDAGPVNPVSLSQADRQFFDRTAASAQSGMLLLAATALIMPAIFELVEGKGLPRPGAEIVNYSGDIMTLSAIVAGVLILSYVAALYFSLKTHRALFNPHHEAEEDEEAWSVKRSVMMLAIAGAAVADMSEILVGSLSDAAHKAGLSEFFEL